MFDYLEGETGIKIIEFFQTGWLSKILSYALTPMNYLGSEIGYLIVLPVIYWTINKKLGKRLFIYVLLGTIITNVLKLWFKRPRPFHISQDTIIPIENTTEYGFPSGHTIFGTLFGLLFFQTYKNKFFRIGCVLFIILMGISRMIHGMHFLQDVVFGWLIGFILYFLLNKLENKLPGFFNKISLKRKLVGISVVIGLYFLFVLVFKNQHEERKDLLSPFAGVIGGILGFLFEEKTIRFSTDTTVLIKIKRGIVGLFTLILFYVLLDFGYYAICGDNEGYWILILYFLRYLLLGFLITAGIPFIFTKLNLK
jgi:membrane-associated phospholipid phosphatase